MPCGESSASSGSTSPTPSGATLFVDRKAVPVGSDGEAHVWHEPGAVPVMVVDASGNEQKQTANLTAGAATEVNIAAPEILARPKDHRRRRRRRRAREEAR